jgi:flagellar secretion chaperone FliS
MSGNQSLAHRYREVAIKTASPLQLIVILYDAAICSIQEAREQMSHRNIASRSRSINKCIAIISELQSSLNLKAGGEIAIGLNKLYDYMIRTIFRANADQSTQPLIEIETLLGNLRSAWVELVKQAPETPPAGQQLPQRGNVIESAKSSATEQKSFSISI